MSEPSQTPPPSVPADTSAGTFVAMLKRPSRSEVALRFVRHLASLVYPLALLASAVFLFASFGPSAWLWLVVLLVVVLAFTGPKAPEGGN